MLACVIISYLKKEAVMLKTNVIEHFGSATKVARFLSITPIAVHYWGDVIPKGRATELHLLTSGELVYDTAHYQKDQVAESEAVA
jgi:hypothetical protein